MFINNNSTKKKNKRNKYYLEFTGLPGSGKTSLTSIITANLEDRGLIVENRSHYTEYFGNKTLLSKSFNLIINMGPIDIKFAYFLGKFLVKQSSVNLRNFKIYTLMLYKFIIFDNYLSYIESDVVILDQNFIQSIPSLLYNKELIIDNDIINVIELLNRKRYLDFVIASKISTSSSFDRISNRKNGTSRLDFVGDKDAINLLEIQNRNFQKLWYLLSSKYNIVSIDMEEDIQVNLNRILELISN